jgi:hypothetical protein
MTDDLVQRLFAEADNFKVDREVGVRGMLYRAADRIEQLEREKAVVSDLWEQQKEIALDYLTDCNKAAERIEAQAAEIERLRVEVKAQYDRGYYDGCANPIVRHDALREALVDLLHAVCGKTGFAETVRRDSGRIYPWPALDLAEAKAVAALEQSK